MGFKRNERDEPHAIRLPGSIMKEIEGSKEGDDNSRFEFGSASYNKKRKAPVSRKDQRKQERSQKKQRKTSEWKNHKLDHQHPSKPQNGHLKAKKSQPANSMSKPVKKVKSADSEHEDEAEDFTGFPSDDDVSEGDFDDFDSEEMDGEDFDEEFTDDEAYQPKTAEDTIKALMALKAKKNQKTDFKQKPKSKDEKAMLMSKAEKEKKAQRAPEPQPESEAVSESSVDDLSTDELDEDDFDDEFTDDEEDQPQTAEDTMKALMALKAKKNQNNVEKKGKKSKRAPEPEPESESVSEFSDDDLSADELDEDDFDEGFTDDEEDQPQTAEGVFAALKAAKEKKKQGTTKSDEKKSKKEEKSKKEKKSQPKARKLTDEEEAMMKRDERDMKHYAKLLGMKSTKIKDFKKNEIDDGLGDLLDGLDFLDAYEGGASQEFDDYEDVQEQIDQIAEEDEESWQEDGEPQLDSDGEEIVENPFSDDDEINSSDFDSDLDGEFDDEDGEDGDVIMAGPKENPYVAPVAAKKYIPPAMRARMAAGSGDSEAVIKVKRLLKGPLNKLSESNFLSILNEVNSVYLDNPRQVVTEVLTSVILESIVQQSVLLDTFVTLHAALMAAIYRTKGVEVGAFFIQTLVEKYEEHFKNGQGKEAGNLLSLLTACYSFQVISCKLLYNLIATLISETTELNSELLLRIVRNAGQQMRSDDPTALKDIILQFQQSVQGKDVNPRTRFLIETITNLRNNKAKTMNEQTQQLITRMRKTMATVTSKSMTEPLQVSLDDIHSVDTKGKWWLVGSAWRGNMAGEDREQEEVEVDREEMNDILDSAEPNWMELARAQRMNTDIRRAIFISIMSSQDYLDAYTKLDKLRLKRSQEREIPKIMLHCVSMEKVYNPYYGLLSNKLCSQHSLRKTFQFCFWDLVKEFEGDDGDDSDGEGDYFKKLNTDLIGEDEDFQLQRTVNLGKFFGVLMAEGSLPLHSLKSLNFLSLNQDIRLFLEVLMISFFDGIGKKSEIAVFGAGAKKSKVEDMRFEDKLLLQCLVKCKEQKILLRGLQYFLQERVRDSDIITGRKQKKRVQWGVDATCDVADEFLKALG